jgi:homocysteine S-methyltransferase
VNCAHPTHVARALGEAGSWREGVNGLRCNASRMSHAELDEALELDEGDPRDGSHTHTALLEAFPNLEVLGGCCGTDVRHVAQLWGVRELAASS